MSGAQTSTFAPPNVLLNTLSGAQTAEVQQNQLMNQGKQLDLSNANMAQVGQAAAGLLSAYPDEASRAAAYPMYVGMLQKDGYAMNAPAQYPGEATLRAIVNTSVPIADQYKMGLITSPQAQANFNAVFGAGGTGTGATAQPTTGGTASGTTTGVATAPSGQTIEPAAFNNATAVRDGLIKRGIDPDTATAFAANALHESIANPATGRGDNGNSAGLFQWAGPRLQAYTDAYGHSPDGSPLDEQLDNVVRELKGSEAPAAAQIAQAQGPAAKAAAVSQYYLRPKDTVPEMQRRSATALQLQQQLGGTSTASAAPATAPAGGGGTQPPAPTQFAGPGAPPGSTAAPAAAPAPDAPWDLPGAPAPDLPPPSTPTAAPAPPGTAPAQPQPAQPAPGPAPAQPTPGQAAQPQPTATGVNSPNFQRAMQLHRQAAMLLAGPGGQLPQNVAMANYLNTNADALLKVDNWVRQPDGTYVNTLTGQPASAPTPAENWVRQPDGTYINQPTGKPMALPPGRLINQPGVGVIQALPGGGAAVVSPVNPAGVQTQSAATASGTAAGTAAGKLVTQLAEQGTRANQAITTIDEGIDNVQKAQAGGVNTGYFAPWITTGLAMAKSIGVDTKALAGVDPSAVGDIQTAKKTLGLVSGQILQQILGPESQITEGKIQHFIGSQPGIETDPQALARVLNWARSQFVYEREQAAQGMEDARAPGAGGILQPNWLPNYYATKGFGPIYNPTAGAMQQPDGQAPPREPPPPAAPPPATPPGAALPQKALSSLVEGHVTTFTNGQQWKLLNGQPVQVK